MAARTAALPYRPGLAVVLVGDDPASAVYVRNKDRAATAAGIAARTLRLPAATSQAELLATIAGLNADAGGGRHSGAAAAAAADRARAVLEAIDPAKDVDGFHPINVGRLHDGAATLVPCTPLGVMKLLAAAGVALRGRARAGAGPFGHRRQADGGAADRGGRDRDDRAFAHPRPGGASAAAPRCWWRRSGRAGDGARRLDRARGRGDRRRHQPDGRTGRLVGDVAFGEAAKVAGAITPVPGGVGPMTIACLLENTVTAAVARRKS